MTADQFHDALTLLSADLVAEADRWRTRPVRRHHRRAYALLAASFLLVLGCGFFLRVPLFAAPASEQVAMQRSAEAPAAVEEAESAMNPAANGGLAMEGSSVEDSASSDAADTVTSQSAASGSSDTPLYPGITHLQTIPALPDSASSANFSAVSTACLYSSREALENCRQTLSPFDPDNLLASCESYDTLWFSSQDLLVLTLYSLPQGTVPTITSMEACDGQWHIQIGTTSAPDSAPSDYHILLSVTKGLIPEDADILLTLP